MKFLKENPQTRGYTYETGEFIISYYDIFFAGYDPRIVKAEKTITSKVTGEKTSWRNWFDLPEDLAIALKIDELLDNWPPKDPEVLEQFEQWLEQRLLDETVKWMNDSL